MLYSSYLTRRLQRESRNHEETTFLARFRLLFPLFLHVPITSKFAAEKSRGHLRPCHPLKCSTNTANARFWNAGLFFITVYNFVVIPLRIAFFSEAPLHQAYPWAIVDNLLDVLYYIDMLLCYRYFAVRVSDSKIFYRREDIGANYLQQDFFLDLVGNLPIDLVALFIFPDDTKFHMWCLFRVAKYLRILRIFKYGTHCFRLLTKTCFRGKNSSVSGTNLDSALGRFLTLVIMTIMSAHIIGCFWFTIANFTMRNAGPRSENVSSLSLVHTVCNLK